MPSHPNLRHVRLFVYAVESNSLSKAAEAVRVSQPAASQAISKLETHFGGELFERRTSGVMATERGRIVAVRAARAIDMLREADAMLAAEARGARLPAGDLLETHATIAHLRAIAGFARSGGFSTAARRMNQAEPSVQRAAREFEHICGVALFEGSHATLRLTPAGIMMAASAGQVLRELESAVEEVRELDGRFDGHIAIGTLPLARTRIVPEAVAECVAAYPGASIAILDGNYDALALLLQLGEIDMLVGALRESPPPRGLAQERLFDDGLSVIARAGHPLAGKAGVAFDDLSRFSWVLPREGTPTRTIFDGIARTNGLCPAGEGVVETGSLVAIRGILLNTDRLTILSRRQIAFEEQAGYLTVIDCALPPTERPIGVTTRAGWKPTALQAAFLEAVRHAAEAG